MSELILMTFILERISLKKKTEEPEKCAGDKKVFCGSFFTHSVIRVKETTWHFLDFPGTPGTKNERSLCQTSKIYPNKIMPTLSYKTDWKNTPSLDSFL